MVLDGSAIVAILLDGPESAEFAKALARARDPVMSAVSFVACAGAISSSLGEEGVVQLDRLLLATGVRCVAVDAEQADAARAAWTRLGGGRSAVANDGPDPSPLSFSGCFSYALARVLDRPLLATGDGFSTLNVVMAR